MQRSTTTTRTNEGYHTLIHTHLQAGRHLDKGVHGGPCVGRLPPEHHGPCEFTTEEDNLSSGPGQKAGCGKESQPIARSAVCTVPVVGRECLHEGLASSSTV